MCSQSEASIERTLRSTKIEMFENGNPPKLCALKSLTYTVLCCEETMIFIHTHRAMHKRWISRSEREQTQTHTHKSYTCTSYKRLCIQYMDNVRMYMYMYMYLPHKNKLYVHYCSDARYNKRVCVCKQMRLCMKANRFARSSKHIVPHSKVST